MRRKLNSNEYECAVCHGIFTRVEDETWSEEKANREYKRLFPNAPMEDREVVCDDCWQKVKPNEAH